MYEKKITQQEGVIFSTQSLSGDAQTGDIKDDTTRPVSDDGIKDDTTKPDDTIIKDDSSVIDDTTADDTKPEDT